MAGIIAQTAEDDVIKKRLLIEGDSGNDDRNINKLCRNFVKWTNNLSTTVESQAANGEEESNEYLNEQIMSCLANVEFGLLRNQFILEMNNKEQKSYESLYDKINAEIERAQSRIVENKIKLQDARKIRKNRQEYSILAKQIFNYPDRLEMESTIQNLESKLEDLKKSEHELDKRLDQRRKQFQSVLHSISSMKNLIESDTSRLDDFYLRSAGAQQPTKEDLLDAKINSLLNDEEMNTNGEADEETKSPSKRGKHYVEMDTEDS